MPAEEKTSRDTFYKTLNVNYNPHLTQKEPHPRTGPIATPFKFYDRHIGPDHTLQRIVHLPSIPHLLSQTCDLAVRAFGAKGYKAEPYHMSSIPAAQFYDAESVTRYYRQHIGNVGLLYLSKLCVCPHVESWRSVFETGQNFGNTFYMAEKCLMVAEDPEEGTIFLDEELEGKLSQSTQDTLHSLLKTFPKMANWHIFPMLDTFTTMLRKMAGTSMPFSSETSRTTGYSFTTRTLPHLDGQLLAKKLGIRRSSRILNSGRSVLDRRNRTKAGKFVTPPMMNKRKQYRPDFRHYLQHAWAQAAIHDTTFIVLHCGRYERIGVRHRASQTLYLSGVIDTVNAKDPYYRRMHIGLHIAIYEDVLERLKSRDSDSQNLNSKMKKRSSEKVEDLEQPQTKKRRKGDNPPTSDIVHASITGHLVSRKLALVSLDYDALSSTVPSSFVRIGESCKRDPSSEDTDWTKDPCEQRKFTENEYFTLTLLAPLGDGAVGVAHPALAEVKLESGTVIKKNLVFKLAFTAEAHESLRHEFDIYCRMSRAGVKGIVDVHGLFFDAESDTLGLLMDDAGKSLRQRDREHTGKYGKKVMGTLTEKEAFTEVIKSLDRARISHRDIRAENLTTDSDGNFFIIDFDCAEYDSSDTLADQLLPLNQVFHDL